MLTLMEGPHAATDRACLSTLGPKHKYLALTKPHYDNIRANITYSRLDSSPPGGRCAGVHFRGVCLLLSEIERLFAPQVACIATTQKRINLHKLFKITINIREIAMTPDPSAQNTPV
jgi:hypothetical protein